METATQGEKQKRPGTTRKGQRRYTTFDRENAITAYMCTSDTKMVSDMLDIPESTIRDWINAYKDANGGLLVDFAPKQSNDDANGAGGGKSPADVHTKTAAAFASHADRILDKMLKIIETELDAVLAGERKVRDLREIMTSAGILYDKRALSRGEATSIEDRRDFSVMSDDEVTETLTTLRALKGGRG